MNHFSSMSGRCGPMVVAAFLMVFNLQAQAAQAQALAQAAQAQALAQAAQAQALAQAQAQALVQDAWARPTVPGQTVGGGYFRIDGGPTADRLLAVSADIAQSVELHTMRMDGDVMRMRQLDSVDVPAKQSVEFKPGGMHVMLIGLKTPLKVGNNFPMTLRFEKAGAVSVNVRVLPAPPSAEHKH